MDIPGQDPTEHEQERIERLRRAMYSRKLSGQIRERPRRALDEGRDVVDDTWHVADEGMDSMTVAPRYIGITRKILSWFLILSVLFFIGAVGFFAYFFTFGGGSLPASPRKIDIVVQGPPQVGGGEPVQLQVTVVNRNRVPLELAELVVKFPPGTRSVTDFSTEFPVHRQSLGTIGPGESRQGTISAVFSGASGQKAPTQFELEYRVEGSSAIFVASKEYAVEFTSSPLSISVDGNTQTTSGQPVQFTVNVASNASSPIKDVALDVVYPFGFKFVNASPAPRSGSTWHLGDFQPGQRKSILIEGTLAGEQGDKRVFRIQAGTRSATSTGVSTRMADNSYEMQISQAFIGIAVNVNGENGARVSAAPGDVVPVTISYRNNLTKEVTDAVIVAKFSGIPVAGKGVEVIEGFYRSADDTILWDKTTTKGRLGNLAPGAEGTLSFSFTMPSPDVLINNLEPKVDITINAAGKRLSESGVPQNLQSSARQPVKLSTNLQIAAQALYSANPFGVSGPSKPVPNVETSYALVFTVSNTTNLVQGAKLTATLPPYVRWIGSFAPRSEKLSFNQFTGTFTWDLGDIEPGTGVDGVAPRQLAIAIGFTPSISQISQQPALVHDVVITGIDSSTGTEISRRASPDVSTNLMQIGKSSSEAIVGVDPGFSPDDAVVGAPVE